MASPMKSDFLAGSHMKLPKIGIAAAVAVVASIVIYLALSSFFVGTDVRNMLLIATSINPVTNGKLCARNSRMMRTRASRNIRTIRGS